MAKLGDNLSVQKGSPPTSRAAAAVAAHPVAEAAPVQPARTRIIVEENEDIPPTGLFLAINGRSYMIRPGEEVDVPQEVIENLNNAITQVAVVNGQKQVTGHRKRMRFPYRVIPVTGRPIAA